MGKYLAAVAAFVALGTAPAGAVTLQEVAAAMGTAKVQSLALSGSGKSWIVGQQFEPSGPYPETQVPRYARSEDYAGSALALDYALVQPVPVKGGGGLAIGTENPRKMGLAGDRAWSFAGPNATAAPQLVAQLQTELWTSPHGIVKAALADNATMSGDSFEVARPGKFKARATVNGRNLVEKVEAWVFNPVLGDTAVVTTYSDYRDVGGALVPMHMMQTTAGFPSLDIVYTDAKLDMGTVAPPAALAPPSPPQVTMDKVADGVWFVAGGSHNSVAIEMADHVILVEAPLGDGRAVAVIDAVRRQIPNKPIRAAIATHVHFDHSGGLRAAASEGIVIAALPAVTEFLRKAYADPHDIAPDRLARANRGVTLMPISEGSIFTDGTRTVEIFEQRGNDHVDGMLFVYLPREKVLIEADAFSPRQPVTAPAANPNPFTANLWQNIQRAHLTPEIVLPIHGRMVKAEELRFAAGAK
jgi:glyoxylase-like metal-dependent hydrolase (beta-lactamase superfamily II)